MFEGTTTTVIEDSAMLAAATHVGRVDWREADRNLRRIAKCKAELDGDEARWLVVAQQAWLHRRFGYASFREYMERVLGYGPRDHTPENLILLCAGHHAAHHDGLISITGPASAAQIVFLRDPPPPPVATASPHAARVRLALVQLGYKDFEARAAIAHAMTHVGHAASFDDLLRAALRASRKPRPSASPSS